MTDKGKQLEYSHVCTLDYPDAPHGEPEWACTQCAFRMKWNPFDPDGDHVEQLYRGTRDTKPEKMTPPRTVRAFLSGFLAQRGHVDPLGQALTTALLTSILALPDDAIEAAIERGHEVRRAS